jgi:crotonobetainyl-CoA:carnitine CoA-transferase CaiB-like acyl-CoA transferase
MAVTATAAAPLAGVTVLDLSRLLPGPFCTQLLVDLGATVIKVEDPAGGDYLRYTPPLLPDGTSVLFQTLNRGKKSVTIDLKSPEGRDAFLALAKDADVVVESFRPGVLEKLGISPHALRSQFPRLVVCSISGYGQTGPKKLRAGHDINYVAHSGAFSLMRVPTVLPIQVADLAGGAWPAAMQICAALVGRASSGEGAIIDVNMSAGVSGLLAMLWSRTVMGEVVDGGRDLLIGGVASYGLYDSADGHLAVGALEPKFWSACCGAIDRPDLVDRGFDGDDVRAIVAGILRTKTTAQWMETFDAVDCCVEAVVGPADAVKDAAHVDVVVGDATLPLPTLGLGIAGHRPASIAAPALGADNDAVFAGAGVKVP